MQSDDKHVVVIALTGTERTARVRVHDREVTLRYVSCEGDTTHARALIRRYDGHADAIALDGLPATLRLGAARLDHDIGRALMDSAAKTPVVDGSGVRATLERWGIDFAGRAQPGIFAERRVLMCPGLNHTGLADALGRHASALRYADPFVFFNLPRFPGVGSRHTLDQAATPTLAALRQASFQRLHPEPVAESDGPHRTLFDRADIVAGDAGTIRRFAPTSLTDKTVVVECANGADVEDLTRRGAALLITTMPSLESAESPGTHSAAVVEALLMATRPEPETPLTEDTYLNLIGAQSWRPDIRLLQPPATAVNRFAFVIHPLAVDFIRRHPMFRWTRFLPDALVEWCAAYMPPLYLSRITGARSPTTGQRVEGYLYALGATPRQMVSHRERFTYRRLGRVARLAERRGARILGLGAFTSVVGDAGLTVAHESRIAITSGNSLTVSATLEAAKQAVRRMGATDLTRGRAMIVGATGSIGAICARLMAQAIEDVVLVSIEPEQLIALKHQIETETPGARVRIGTETHDELPHCDLVVTATSAFGQRVVDLARCKPGAVVCDVARPHDISPEEAAVRPDVLVIDSGEVLIPGEVDFGYDIGLPPKVAYACLAETALLAMEGLFVDYTLGRDLEIDKVKEIYRLFKKHGFRIAGLRSFDQLVTDAQVAEKKRLAEALRADPARLERTMSEAAVRLAVIPAAAKGIAARRQRRPWVPVSWPTALLKRFGR